MPSRVVFTALAVVLLPACGSTAGHDSSDMTAGSRWNSPLSDGFYDGADQTIRLYDSVTEQRFEQVATDGGLSFCRGATDWTNARLEGDTCSFGYTSSDGPLTLTGENGETTLPRRTAGAIDGQYAKDPGTDLVTPAYFRLLNSSDSGLSVDVVWRPEFKMWPFDIKWGDGAYAEFHVDPCDYRLVVDRVSGGYQLNVAAKDDCQPWDTRPTIAGIYNPIPGPP